MYFIIVFLNYNVVVIMDSNMVIFFFWFYCIIDGWENKCYFLIILKFLLKNILK